MKRDLSKLVKQLNECVEMAKALTTKERKAMKKGTFCGPNRSFPVNDCTRVRAAKVYLKRSKFSQATKKRIAACINRKAKALGCPGKIPAKAEMDAELMKIMEEPMWKETQELIDFFAEELEAEE